MSQTPPCMLLSQSWQLEETRVHLQVESIYLGLLPKLDLLRLDRVAQYLEASFSGLQGGLDFALGDQLLKTKRHFEADCMIEYASSFLLLHRFLQKC